jgi:hypothetical protein
MIMILEVNGDELLRQVITWCDQQPGLVWQIKTSQQALWGRFRVEINDAQLFAVALLKFTD